MNKSPLQLHPDFNFVLDKLEKERRNLFITGRAGTGKSTLLQLYRRTTRCKCVVLAPTGIAALNIKGQTIHSFFGFPPRLLQSSDIKKRRQRQVYKNLDVLIIDEISMVRADLLDHIDYFLRINRDNPEPFGGLQVVFFGDLFQLPPVVAGDTETALIGMQYSSPYFFSAAVFRDHFQMDMFELRHVFRQRSRHFLRLLDAVRLNMADADDLAELNERYQPRFEPKDFFITLTARNATANTINRQRLEAIALPSRTYMAEITGNFNPKLFPTEAALVLKPEAQVMFLKNDPDRRFVNGTIGKVQALKNGQVKILIQEAGQFQKVEVSPMTWEIIRYKTKANQPEQIEAETVGSFTQYPLRLAWAVTIHKSQGKTFDKVVIDLGRGAFEHGQTYVALSRCRTLEGIVLKKPIRPEDIRTDPRILDFYEQNFIG